MKKLSFLILFISITVILSMSSQYAFAIFPDVTSSNANYDAIDYVKNKGIVSGYPDGTFKPFNNINRAEFTKIIINAQFGASEIDTCLGGYDTFPDVPKAEWFAKYVCLAKKKGVIGGYPDGTFKPADYINFAEASKIIVNAFGYQIGTDDIWYKPYVEELGERSAIPTTVKSFEHNITRGEMAEMIWRLKENIRNMASYTYSDFTGTTSSSKPTGPTASLSGITYYVRSDGGSNAQCNGLADKPYPGSGSGQNCAWDHPFRAFPPEETPKIKGGDNLIIASGSYMMGLGAPGADVCESDYPWDCTMPAVPSGTASNPTRILGAGWDSGCSNPPELWGTERANQIFNLTDSSNVEIACFEITDHSNCVESHSGNIECNRNNYPFGKWAEIGLYAEDSSNVHLKDLDIHGFGHGGVLAGRLTDWTVENVRIAANGWVGWDGDIDGNDSNSGTLHFKNWTVEWNGCGETWPGKQPTDCWAQTAGGYGDGVGTGETGGNWIIEDSAFLHNTSDGLDLLYTRVKGSNITIRRTIAEGNAGNQIKTTGPTTIENTVAIGNCGFFEGKPFTYNVDNCRAGGGAISIDAAHGDLITWTNNTFYSEGDCMTGVENAQKKTTVFSRNNIFLGATDFEQPFENTCLFWTDDSSRVTFDNDYSIIHNVKDYDPVCPIGGHDICENPMLKTVQKDNFDLSLKSGSPAINTGSTSAPSVDINNKPRDSKPDIGAYEY